MSAEDEHVEELSDFGSESALTSWCYDNSILSEAKTDYENTITDIGVSEAQVGDIQNWEEECIE